MENLPDPHGVAETLRGDRATIDGLALKHGLTPMQVAVGLKEAGYTHTGIPLELTKARPWTARALCAQTDPEAFFPEKGASPKAAKRVCMACEVRAECLEYAVESGERYGVYGGLSERERRPLIKARERAA